MALISESSQSESGDNISCLFYKDLDPTLQHVTIMAEHPPQSPGGSEESNPMNMGVRHTHSETTKWGDA